MRTKSLTFLGAMAFFATFGSNAQTPESKTENQIIKFDAAPPPNATEPRRINAEGSIITLDLSASGTGASSINALGEITGSYNDASFIAHGFFRDREGAIVSFDAASEAVATVPVSINREGAITGYYYTEVDVFHGFVRQKDGTDGHHVRRTGGV